MGRMAAAAWRPDATFDTSLQKIIDTKEDMARRVSTIVRDRTEKTEFERIIWKRTSDLAAWEHILLAQDHLRRSPLGRYAEAIRHFEAAQEIDSESVDALVGMATNYCWAAKSSAPANRREVTATAERYVRKAVEPD